MDAFKGKYERTSADKYEEMLKELDVNFLLRKAATVSTPGAFPSKYGSSVLQTGLLLQFVISRRRGASGPSRPPPPSRPWSSSSRYVTIGSLTFWQLWTLFSAEYFLNI